MSLLRPSSPIYVEKQKPNLFFYACEKEKLVAFECMKYDDGTPETKSQSEQIRAELKRDLALRFPYASVMESDK
jgi:hypothetical protein